MKLDINKIAQKLLDKRKSSQSNLIEDSISDAIYDDLSSQIDPVIEQVLKRMKELEEYFNKED